MVGLGRTQTVNAGDACDNQHVPPLEQGMGGGMAHFVNLVVDGCVFFDEGIRGGHVRFRLVVIVVTDEVADRVIRKKGFEFVVQLRRQGFVVGQYQGGSLKLLDDIGHRISFARTGYPQQGLVNSVGAC